MAFCHFWLKGFSQSSGQPSHIADSCRKLVRMLDLRGLHWLECLLRHQFALCHYHSTLAILWVKLKDLPTTRRSWSCAIMCCSNQRKVRVHRFDGWPIPHPFPSYAYMFPIQGTDVKIATTSNQSSEIAL